MPAACGRWRMVVPQVSVSAAASYTGPGDTFTTSPLAAYSCAQAFTAAYATALSAACDVVDTATGLVTCTYHFQANGSVNPTECNTSGKSCFTACSVTKAYDHTGNGHDASQATLANMPGLTFSSTPSGTLPAIDCNLGTNPLLASGTIPTALFWGSAAGPISPKCRRRQRRSRRRLRIIHGTRFPACLTGHPAP